jgi:hypothetical protein
MIGSADRINVSARLGRVNSFQSRRQIKVNSPGGVGRHVPREILGTDAQVPAIKRSNHIVGAEYQDADNDRGCDGIKRGHTQRQPELQ